MTEKIYCEYIKKLDTKDPDKIYHDTLYGFPVKSDDELFGRLVLELNQAGLSWKTIMDKSANFRKEYDNFNIVKIANYKAADRRRLLKEKGIIRNTLKINAAIYNANAVLDIKKTHKTFKKWLDSNHPMRLEEWVKLFKKHFKFTGPEITKEFLQSTGYLPCPHKRSCPIYKKLTANKNKKSSVKSKPSNKIMMEHQN